MVPIIAPDNVDYMTIAMKEKARIRDKMPSAILNFAFGSDPNDGDAQQCSGAIFVSSSPTVNRTHSHVRSHLCG